MGILYFVVLLGIIVTIHELGHFVAAKIFGVYCGEFSIGMGPKLFSIQGKETKYSIRLLPIGGYVQMAGEVDNALEGECTAEVPFERTIKGISRWKQIVVMLAGIFMNFVLAWVLFTGILMNQGVSYAPNTPVVGSVLPKSPAEQAGFQANDEILSVKYSDGTLIIPQTFSEMSSANLNQQTGERIYEVRRGSEILTIAVTPVYDAERGSYLIGINEPIVTEYPNLFEASMLGIQTMGTVTELIVQSVLDLVRGRNLDQLAGPIGIYTVTEKQASLGLVNYIWLIALLSLNVAIFNALPLPILDGGRALLAVLEIIRGKAISEKLEQGMMAFGLAVILLLMVFATWQDLTRLFVK